LAVLGVPPTLGPFVTTDPDATVLLRAFHTPLVDFKPDGTMIPNLASDWKAEPTGWTIRIRDNAKFSADSPVAGDDVKASFDFWTDPANKYPGDSNLLPYIKSASVVDAKTVRFDTPNSVDGILRGETTALQHRCLVSDGQPEAYAVDCSTPEGSQAVRHCLV
jgi:ABC-type transport system substrate-binding protein